MTDTTTPHITFAEWLPTGVVVHFDGGFTVFYPAVFLFENRQSGTTTILEPAPDSLPG